jgi:hypothetical protein
VKYDEAIRTYRDALKLADGASREWCQTAINLADVHRKQEMWKVGQAPG